MPFHVPPNIVERVCAGADLGFQCDEKGVLHGGFDTGWADGTPYPPPGYLPWNRLDVGNGDTYGYYWPIGREASPPIVCTLMHDAWELFPVATSLESAARLHLAAGHACEEWTELAEDFGVPIDGCEPADVDVAEGAGVPYWGVESSKVLLPLDPRSPSLLVRAAQEAAGANDLDASERALVEALSVLPEYTAAWWGLLQLRRRRRDPAPQIIDAALNCITCPLAFGHFDRQRCLGWLKRMSDSDAGEFADDPLIRRRARLTFAEGAETNPDYDVYDEAIAEYHAQGFSIRALRLRILYGELIGSETISFRERRNFTWQKYWQDLRHDCELAGLHARLDAMPS